MQPVGDLGRWLILAGIVLVALGLVVVGLARWPGLGRLPGDVIWRRGSFTLYLPITTMVLISIILTIVLNVVTRFRR
jgi:hypothetical protein